MRPLLTGHRPPALAVGSSAALQGAHPTQRPAQLALEQQSGGRQWPVGGVVIRVGAQAGETTGTQRPPAILADTRGPDSWKDTAAASLVGDPSRMTSSPRPEGDFPGAAV